MEMNVFVDQLLAAAKAGGIETAEAYAREEESFSAKAMDQQIEQYEVSATRSLSLRGTVGGKMGYASTEAFDDEAIRQLVEGVIEGAALNEEEEQDEIFPGEERYPELAAEENDFAEVPAEDRLAIALGMEAGLRAADERIRLTEGSNINVSQNRVLLRNSYGLNLERRGSLAFAYTVPVARDGEATAIGIAFRVGRKLKNFDPDAIAREAADEALSMLHAEPVASGDYRVVLRWDAMQSLLSAFSGIFSAENAQQKLSLLAGREGESIAAPIVTLMDDPLRAGGLASRAFDDEGSACRTKAVVEAGVLKTLLHSRKTARKQGVETTGNAAKAGGAVHVAPTNFYLEPGGKTLDDLLKDMGEGLLITDLSGLHAGANPISGDFSLLSKGYVVKDGKKVSPVERVTIAGNFYQLLRDIRAIGCDLNFPGSGIGAPSADVGTLKVSGK